MKNQKGFTLIELMIVVAIIAILAAIAISQYQDYVIRSQVSEGSALADGTKTAIAEFYNNTGRFPPSNESAGLAGSASIIGNYVSGVDVGSTPGIIEASYAGPKANTALASAVLQFSAITSAGSINWTCKAKDPGVLLPKWLPSNCR